MNTVIILRGIPGAGKNLIADTIANLTVLSGRNTVICCADDYYIEKYGYYKWVADEIHDAHNWCEAKFKKALEDCVDVIIVANTCTRERDVNAYRNVAIKHNYITHVLVVENWHNGKDTHNVPEDVKDAMTDQLKNSIKLYPTKKPEIVAFLTRDKMKELKNTSEPIAIGYEQFLKQTETTVSYSYFEKIFNSITFKKQK